MPRPARGTPRACVTALTGGALAGLAALLLPLPAASQGYGSAPFREHPVAVAQAAALERIEIAARALALRAGDLREEDDTAEAEAEGEGEEDEGGMAADLGFFRASLAAAAPALEAELVSAIDALLEAAGTGGALASPSAAVIDLATRARAALVPPEAAASPGFRGALAASILLEEGGIAEAYEGAVEGEAGAYEIGWVAFQRVTAIWEGLADVATESQAADVAEVLAVLQQLFPGETPPETLSPNPEQAEAPAHQLVGILEAVTGAELYPGRDFAAAAGLVAEVAALGCASIAAGAGDRGSEELAIAAAYYDQTVGSTLQVIAPQTGEAIAALFAATAGDGHDGAACDPLIEALAAGREVLTP